MTHSNKTNQTTQEFGNMQQTEVASQSLPPNGIQPQNAVTATVQLQESQTWNKPVPFQSRSNSCPTVIQVSRMT